MYKKLLVSIEVDGIMRWRAGKAERLARKNMLPHLLLPTDEVRFTLEDVEQILSQSRRETQIPRGGIS